MNWGDQTMKLNIRKDGIVFITIPKEIREQLKWEKGNQLQVFVSDKEDLAEIIIINMTKKWRLKQEAADKERAERQLEQQQAEQEATEPF